MVGAEGSEQETVKDVARVEAQKQRKKPAAVSVSIRKGRLIFLRTALPETREDPSRPLSEGRDNLDSEGN
jgi:hypothetical protein